MYQPAEVLGVIPDAGGDARSSRAGKPEWSWERLRQETPGDAALYINHAVQPCLVVPDVKLGEAEGAVALWVGSDTEGYFRNLAIEN